MSTAKPLFRQIQQRDLEAIADLLTRDFVGRSRDYWMRGLHRQSTRSLPPEAPRFGYLMENDGRPVGCLLLIYSTKMIGGEATICCNVSSWYVEPQFRTYAALLASMTQKHKNVTYFNVTPDVPTWPILEAQGFQAYCRGVYVSLPVLSRRGRGMRVEAVNPDMASIPGLSESELEMLKRHASYGCVSLVCRTAQEAVPFIFFPLRKRRGIIPLPGLQLGFCREVSDLVRRGRDRTLSAVARPAHRYPRRQRSGRRPCWRLQRGARPQIFQGTAAAKAWRSRRHRARHFRDVSATGEPACVSLPAISR